MSHHEILLEPIYDNANIRHVTCRTVLTKDNAPAGMAPILHLRAIHRLRDLRARLACLHQLFDKLHFGFNRLPS